MSPEIRIAGQVVADVPDTTGMHQMLDGSELYVDVSGIAPHNKVQRIVLHGPRIGGRRVVLLTQEGKGGTTDSKRKGDQQEPALEVVLKQKPIRVSYRGTERIWQEPRSLGERGYRREIKTVTTHRNPYWITRR